MGEGSGFTFRSTFAGVLAGVAARVLLERHQLHRALRERRDALRGHRAWHDGALAQLGAQFVAALFRYA